MKDDERSGAVDAESFRKQAHQVVDWMADYMRDVGGLPVVPDVKPGDVKKQLPPSPPDHPDTFEEIWGDFKNIILPGMTHWNHPGWFAYFPANHSPASMLAEMATAAIGAQCMSWQTSPAATELEEVVMRWLREMTGLPGTFQGVIQDTASTSTLVAMLTAREVATKHGFAQYGGRVDGGDRLTVYASTEAHSSVEKAVKMSGIGLARYRRIAVDHTFAMIPSALEEAMAEDVEAGLKPCCVVGVTGTTSSSGIDDLQALGEVAKKHGAWFHVDAAYGGPAAILPEMRYIFNGIEHVDSLVFNPHKWLFTNFDCSAYFVRDVMPLLKTFSMDPEYLKTAHDAVVHNYRDWGIQLGRRFRALKLWFVIRSYGVDGLRSLIRGHIDMAAAFRSWVETHPDFEVMAPSPLGLVCFRYRPAGSDDDEVALETKNRRLLEAVNREGPVHLTHTKLRGSFAIRMSIGQLQTTPEDVAACWKLFTDKARSLSGNAEHG